MAHSLMFLWVQGIDGLSQDPRHLREIEVASFSFGPKGSATFGSALPVELINDFTFIKRIDGVSNLLYQAALSGKHFAKAILTVERNFGGRSAGELLRVVMSDILITSFQRDPKSGAPIHEDFESIGLNYASVNWKHNG